jgi:hypothetical protein
VAYPVIDQREVDFIRKWIFPGGFLPTVSFVVDAIRTGSKDRLVVDSISNIGVSSIAAHTVCHVARGLCSADTLVRSRITPERSVNGGAASSMRSMIAWSQLSGRSTQR